MTNPQASVTQKATMSAAIIAGSPGAKIPGGAKEQKFTGIFGEVQRGVSGPSLETLTKNKQMSIRVASMLREDKPDWAMRLHECHRRIQHGQGGWLTNKYCRLWRYCLNCQAVRGGIIRDAYVSSVLAFQQKYAVDLQLQSMVLHVQAGYDKTDPTEALHAFAPVIAVFNERLCKYRAQCNAKILEKPRPRRTELIGPIMCVPHILPTSICRIAGRRTVRPLKLHLHVLAANHPKRLKRAFAAQVELIWLTSANASPTFIAPTSTVMKLQETLTEDAEHTANTVAYTSRSIKAGWNASQIISVAGHIEQSPQLGTVYISGQVGKRKEMPNSLQLKSQTLLFDQETLQYV